MGPNVNYKSSFQGNREIGKSEKKVTGAGVAVMLMDGNRKPSNVGSL